jgi:hypothetical protein
VTGKEVNLRMGKKIGVLSGIALFALTLTLAACGKKEEPPPPPPPAPAEPAPAPAPEAAPPAGGEQKAGEPAKDMEKGMEKTEEGKTK